MFAPLTTDRIHPAPILLLLATCMACGTPAFADGDSEKFTMGNFDLRGSRSLPNPSGGSLTRSAVAASGLEVKWFAETDHPVAGVPVVAEGVVYVGTATADGSGLGSVYAFDAETGAELWQAGSDEGISGGVVASPLIAGGTLYVGTLSGSMHALRRDTGEVVWSYKPAITFFDSIWAGPIKIRNTVIFALNPQDEYATFDPPGVSALIAVNAQSGAASASDEIWRFTPVPAAEHANVGGAGIWGTSPAYSSSLNLVFVSTGQTTFSRNGDTFGGDTVFAIDVTTGEIRWQNQVKQGDVWNLSLPFDPVDPVDMDVGEAPAVFNYRGKERVAVGSKRGYFYVMDAETGAILNGPGVDGLGFKMGLDLFGGSLPGPGIDGGFNLDSGFFETAGEVIHFGVVNDYSAGMQAVVNRVPPYNDGICFAAGFGPPPPCPPINFGHLVLISGDGSAELGRYSNVTASIYSPIHLDGMVFVRETADLTAFDNDKLQVIDVSNPASPTLMETVELSHPDHGPSYSLGAQVSVANGRIFTGNGAFGFSFGSTSGLYSIGLANGD